MLTQTSKLMQLHVTVVRTTPTLSSTDDIPKHTHDPRQMPHTDAANDISRATRARHVRTPH